MSSLDDDLRAKGLLPPKPERAALPPVSLHGTGDLAPYLRSALEAEVAAVINTAEGSRNHALNVAAFSLGQLVAGAGLPEGMVVEALTAAGRSAGLDDKEIAATINSGLTGGAKEPRGIPESGDYTVAPMPAFDDVGQADAYIYEHLPRLDWSALWADEDDEEWIVEPLLPARRLVALYSAPKLGKSLLMLEIAVAVALGTEVLGSKIDRARRVLYVDFENDPKSDIRTRLQNMGYGPVDLDGLVYLSFPTLAVLDSDRGGAELMQAVKTYACEVVVVDTVSRSVGGEENENDTWLAFYRHTGLKLKQAGVALVRLDHSGKDETKGQRGGSAKSGDVDAVWRLSHVVDDTYRLTCEAARMQVSEKTLVIEREDSPLRHQVRAAGTAGLFKIKGDALLVQIDEIGLPDDAGRPAIQTALAVEGITATQREIDAAVLVRKARMVAYE